MDLITTFLHFVLNSTFRSKYCNLYLKTVRFSYRFSHKTLRPLKLKCSNLILNILTLNICALCFKLHFDFFQDCYL